MRKRFLIRFFLTLECATSIFGSEVVSRSAKYKFFKKNLRVRTEDLLEVAVLAGASLATEKAQQLMVSLPEKFSGQATISPSDLKTFYVEFRKSKLDHLSEVSFLSGAEIAYLLHCGVCSVYGAEGFPVCVKEGIFQVKRWSTNEVLEWAEKSIYVPSQKPTKKAKKTKFERNMN